MCGRFTTTSSIEDLATSFDVDEIRADPVEARYNIAPTQPVLAVATRPGAAPVRALGQFRWGLVPSWAKDPSVGSRMINARADTVATKPAYRKALARRRCLIPADAFYEWQAVEGQKTKQPWAIALADGSPMALAGLWEVWRDAEGERLRTCVIVTTDANQALAPIHHRMPVVLGRSAWDRWLDPGFGDVDALGELMVPAPDAWFTAFPVVPLVNKVANEGPELLERVAPAG